MMSAPPWQILPLSLWIIFNKQTATSCVRVSRIFDSGYATIPQTVFHVVYAWEHDESRSGQYCTTATV